MNQTEYQKDFFEVDRVLADFHKMQEDFRKLQKAAFAQITTLRKEIEMLEAHCQIMSDELFKREIAQ